MTPACRFFLAVSLAGAPIMPAGAQERAIAPAAGVEISASTDSDKTDIVKVLGRALWSFNGRDTYQGLAIERFSIRPLGQAARREDRLYLDLAAAGEQWLWKARIGTDRHTLLGSASLRSRDWSKEFFLERDLVETRRGVEERLYHTFIGGSFDLNASDRDVLNAVLGVQKFTGRNTRLHLRATYIHVIRPKSGISLQLRTRYFHSTVPGEFDYFSPRDFVQVLPVGQIRRFTSTGWMYQLGAGYGLQKSTDSRWQDARFAEARVESPGSAKNIHAFALVQYGNNSPTFTASGYDYAAVRVGLTVRME